MPQPIASQLDAALDAYARATRHPRRGVRGARSIRRGDWLKYAAAAGASLAGSVADAEVMTFLPNEPLILDVVNRMATGIDLDDDGDFDMQFGASANYNSTFGNRFFASVRGYGSGRVIGSSSILSGSDVTVRRYAAGMTISPFSADAGGVARVSFTYAGVLQGEYGQWGADDTAYAAFVLGFGTPDARAGWIKIQTRSSGTHMQTAEVLQWAFETVPGATICAGDSGAGCAGGGPGDYSGNGTVGPEDYTAWSDQFGETAVPAGSGADGNSDGVVNAADYVVWRNNLQTGVAATNGASIPEPQSVTLAILALGTAGIAALRRR